MVNISRVWSIKVLLVGKLTLYVFWLNQKFSDDSGYGTAVHRGGKSGRFREFDSQKIFSKTRFDRKYLGNNNIRVFEF